MRIINIIVLLNTISLISIQCSNNHDINKLNNNNSRNLLLIKKRNYGIGDPVFLWANKVGPFTNPSETYQYYTLPFCKPEHENLYEKFHLSSLLEANRFARTPYQINFRIGKELFPLCTLQLNGKDINKFRNAIDNDWYYQMYLDDLPIWGFIGKKEKLKHKKSEKRYYIYSHLNFIIDYNGLNVIAIKVSTDPQQVIDITDNQSYLKLQFSYSVHWKPTTIDYNERLNALQDYLKNPEYLKIHWFSIVNSSLIVILLAGALGIIFIKFLKNDFKKYNRDDELLDPEEEIGWKYIHGDVFRYPKLKMLFCAFIGTGTQMFFLSVFVFLLSLIGTFYPHNRGALFTTLLILYALTACIAGYNGCSYFKQMGGTKWVNCILLLSVIFCGPFFIMFCFLNTIALIYGSTAALPFSLILIIILIWAIITIPLTIFGGIVGKNNKLPFYAPVRTNKVSRDIPIQPWYNHLFFTMFLSGILSFSSIYIQLYYIFSTIWGHEIYIIWSVLTIVFSLLILLTIFVNIVLVYFQLASEDHHWWWRSFLNGGSTGLFIFAYSFYFFWISDMNGFMQTAFYFGYMAMISFASFIMLGTVGWRASLLFIRIIYKNVSKCE